MISAIVKQIPQNIKTAGDFMLLSKVKKVDIQNLDKNKIWRAPKDAVSFDYVQIGKVSDSGYSKEIISFFDKNKKLVSRTFRENGRNIRKRQYKYNYSKRTITDFIFDSSRILAVVNDATFNLGGIWKKVSEETQWIKKIYAWKKDGKIPTDLHTRRIDFHPETEEIDKITLTQYPINHGRSSLKKRFITGKFQQTPDDLNLVEATYSKNLDLDFSDKYLKYRFFDLHTPEGLVFFTKGLLQNKGLAPLNIAVEPNSLMVHSKNLAYFDDEFGKIYFGKRLLKDYDLLDIVDTAAHEVEHAKQISMIGRREKGTTKYEREALRILGGLTDPKEQQEAINYAIAKEDYSSTGHKYTNNLLEVKAREAGRNIAEDFQYPIENFNFFERFN